MLSCFIFWPFLEKKDQFVVPVKCKNVLEKGLKNMCRFVTELGLFYWAKSSQVVAFSKYVDN
jgi:hypothetical protein